MSSAVKKWFCGWKKGQRTEVTELSPSRYGASTARYRPQPTALSTPAHTYTTRHNTTRYQLAVRAPSGFMGFGHLVQWAGAVSKADRDCHHPVVHSHSRVRFIQSTPCNRAAQVGRSSCRPNGQRLAPSQTARRSNVAVASTSQAHPLPCVRTGCFSLSLLPAQLSAGGSGARRAAVSSPPVPHRCCSCNETPLACLSSVGESLLTEAPVVWAPSQQGHDPTR
jgi:hypothetical protein